MNLEKLAWEQLQHSASLRLGPDFAQKTITLARCKARAKAKVRTIVFTGVICFFGIMVYHWRQSSLVHAANLNSWNEQQFLLVQIESTY